MPRKKLIAANWKMHKSIADTKAFSSGLLAAIGELSACDLAVYPPFLSVPAAASALSDTDVIVGAQDLYWEKQGAFTGEVSGSMIRDAGGTSVVVGHSERRHVLGETDEVVGRKLKAALEAGLIPVLCVGEKIEQREAGKAEAFVKDQLMSALSLVSEAELSNIVIAYEPVWAIGTGKTATPEDAEAMHGYVRGLVADRFGAGPSESLRILYGGSVKPDNAESLLMREQIDGALIGGASLELESYLKIAAAVR